MYLQNLRQKNNQQNRKWGPKKILDKEITQIKYSKTACYLDTKDHDKIKEILCFLSPKNQTKKQSTK